MQAGCGRCALGTLPLPPHLSAVTPRTGLQPEGWHETPRFRLAYVLRKLVAMVRPMRACHTPTNPFSPASSAQLKNEFQKDKDKNDKAKAEDKAKAKPAAESSSSKPVTRKTTRVQGTKYKGKFAEFCTGCWRSPSRPASFAADKPSQHGSDTDHADSTDHTIPDAV